MLFFARCVVWAIEMLPKSKFRREVGLLLGYADCRRKIVAWHFAELKKLDPLFALSQEALRISAAYDQAEATGIGPLDPRYPSLLASGIDWKKELRVHRAVLEKYRKTGKERMERMDKALQTYPQERVDTVTQACVSASKKENPSGSGTTTP